jgi:hypothetical protein
METLESETFDWNNLEQNPNLELWAVRIPKGVRHPSYHPRCHLTDALPFSRLLRTFDYTVASEGLGWPDDCAPFFHPVSFDYSAGPL